MHYRIVLQILGRIIILVGLSMLLPLLVAFYCHEREWQAFAWSAVITIAAGIPLSLYPSRSEEIRRREGCAIVTLSWVAAALFGCLPYLFAGSFPHFADALFETVSGFTTTGSSVMTDIESHSHAILFWRSLTHWLGGMGIVVLFVALLAHAGVGGLQMVQAEAPGPVTEKLRPRIQETAKILWSTYLIFTVAEVLLLWAAGLTLFDAVIHTFGTVATGGFSSKNASVSYYSSPLVHWIITFFTFLSGSNFALYYQALRLRSPFYFWRNPEFRLYSAIIIFATIVITADLIAAGYQPGEQVVRTATFQVVTIITTTGFSTADFDTWPGLSRTLIFMLMFIGGCYGSTGGAIKVGRWLVVLKNSLAELYRTIHPHVVCPVRLGDDRVLKENLVINILQFICLYLLIFAFGTLAITMTGLRLEEAASAVTTTLGNVGPGLGAVGPARNFAHLPAAAKYLLSWLMLVGRLEIYTVLALFLRSTWRR